MRAKQAKPIKTGTGRRGWLFNSPYIARRIFVSNLAGLIILIIGAMVLNEMRTSFVLSKKQDLIGQADLLASFIADKATYGTPAPAIDEVRARTTLAALSLPETLRGKIYTVTTDLVGDSYFMSARVSVSDLPAIRQPGWFTMFSRSLSEWTENLYATLIHRRASKAIATRTFEDEFAAALRGQQAASQRFNDRGQRIISVSVPIQHVSAIVGILTLESTDLDRIVRAERTALLPFVSVALLVALITSGLLTAGIAKPLRKLADAADKVRTGSNRRLNMPDIKHRRDEIGQLARAIEAMTATLLERITANEAFAADVAHELKNPLTSIRSAVETLDKLDDKDRQASATLRKLIAKDADRLDHLITDISNASRLEAEMGRTPVTHIDMRHFLRDVVQAYQDMTMDKTAKITFVDSTYGDSVRVFGREGPLGQVLRNLIDNALSFSPPHGTVTVRLEQGTKGHKAMIHVIVDDDGPGLHSDTHGKIFGRFYTDRPRSAASDHHSGLGLSIVAQITANHKGTVHAENRKDGGARFIVALPLV